MVKQFQETTQKGSRSVVAAIGSWELFSCGKTNTPRPLCRSIKPEEKQPEFPPILRSLGEAYLMNGQQTKAKHVLEKALELDHSDKAALFLMGTLYEEQGNISKSPSHIQETLLS
jgi:Tfp pilus assembly protein PilF